MLLPYVHTRSGGLMARDCHRVCVQRAPPLADKKLDISRAHLTPPMLDYCLRTDKLRKPAKLLVSTLHAESQIFTSVQVMAVDVNANVVTTTSDSRIHQYGI